MKTKISDLRMHLFEQMERLNDETLKGELLAEEITRAKAIADIAGEITKSADLEVRAIKDFNEYFGTKFQSPKFLEIENGMDG